MPGFLSIAKASMVQWFILLDYINYIKLRRVLIIGDVHAVAVLHFC